MLEQCIVIGKARYNDNSSNRHFSPELKNIDIDLDNVMKKIEDLRKRVEDDLESNKSVNLVNS